MLIAMGKADSTMYYQFLQSWLCWANDQILGEDYWSITEVTERQDQVIIRTAQVVSMNEIVFLAVTTAVELLMDILRDLWVSSGRPPNSHCFEIDSSLRWGWLQSGLPHAEA
jgi:hypothetical protein